MLAGAQNRIEERTRFEDREVDGVILRRTIIDEVIVPPQGAATNDPTRTNHATH
jgi:hypothetical protein